eukprot:TRINITY_DN2008_c0_g1_i143.p2 TRINITY_DN2008_c0_g1~~TRINITY_DN2008_c0_g1_i143.p2  ORF type:complete len:104 (+),score=12.53 TRINITY_DN2008_c0_g1_i143:308-619(+)
MHSNPLLSGTIPDSLGSLTQLVYLLMHSNPSLTPYPTASESSISLCLLSGTVPDSLGSLDQLQWLLIHSNPLLPYPTASEASAPACVIFRSCNWTCSFTATLR